MFLKRRHITWAVASSSGNIGFVGVCDFKLGQLTNIVSKEIHAENGKKMAMGSRDMLHEDIND